MDGVISLPICVAGFFLIPDLPENTRAFYLTENVSYLVTRTETHTKDKKDRVIAKKRMESVGRAPRGKLGWSSLRRIFGMFPSTYTTCKRCLY
jgi:ACS family pantothenate transporter-like MFS transporter